MIRSLVSALLLFLFIAVGVPSIGSAASPPDFPSWEWTEIDPAAPWAARAGLQVVEHRDRFFLMGGRTPLDPSQVPVFGASKFWSDVWVSLDRGESWEQIADDADPTHWAPRAYFKAVRHRGRLFVLGGQDFNVVDNPGPGPPQIVVSQFFNDVWSSKDGFEWDLETDDAPWEGRAGLSAAVFKGRIYVMAGSFNDDSAVIGGPPERVFFNDVWCSHDGRDWELVAENASWSPRAGARIAVLNGRMYLVGGEVGFTCDSGPQCPPFFNDVWATKDGANWELVTPSAPWVERPGHEVVVAEDHMILFGGFGLGPDLTIPANPMDVWVSQNGADWWQVSDSPWNATSPAEIKYDFAAVVAETNQETGGHSVVYTFGGDRETFNPFDPTNWLNVDNDVWEYAPPVSSSPGSPGSPLVSLRTRLTAAPNPVRSGTQIRFTLDDGSPVDLALFDASGRLVRKLAAREFAPGSHTVSWDGRDNSGRSVSSGVYFYRLQTRSEVQTRRLLVVR